MTLIEKAAYIKGLVDGMELDKESKEGKVIAALVDLLGEVVESIDGLEADVDELYEYAEELDEDLGEVESVLCEDDDEDYDDFEDECDGMCDECDLECDLDDDFFEIECPSCGEVVCFDESIDPEELACTACGEKFECLVDEDDLKAIDGE